MIDNNLRHDANLSLRRKFIVAPQIYRRAANLSLPTIIYRRAANLSARR